MAKLAGFFGCHVYVRGLSLVAAVAFLISGADAARAQGFKDQVAGKTEIYLKDIPGVGSLLNQLRLSRLANTQMVGVTSTPDTISGYVNFLAMRWNFLVFKAKTETFFALEPVTASGAPRAPKITDFLNPKVKPIKDMMDLLTLDRLVWVIAARNVELDNASLPAGPVKTMFSPYFGNSTLAVEFGQGVTFLGAADLGKVGVLKQGIEAIGGQSTNVLVKAGFQTAVLDSMIQGSAPTVTASFQAALPPVKPKLFNKIQLPTTFTVSLVAEMAPLEGTVKLGYVAEAANVPFVYPDIAKKKVATANTAMDIQVAVAMEGGKPVFSVAGTMFKGRSGAFKQAFGLPFLDLQDYTMAFEVKADALAVGIGAGGRFYDKNITTFAAVQVPAQTAGIPIPDQIKFMVEPTNANAVGALSLKDLTNAFADLTNAVTGSNIPKPNLPEKFVQIAGTERGLGPFVDVNLNMGLDAGLEMGGKMVVFEKELGVIETAVLKPTHGIEIKGRTDGDLPLDILRLPQGEVDIAVTKDNIADPHVRVKVDSMSILGSSGSFEFSIDKAKQVAVVEGAAPFKLFEASLVLESDTGNLKNPNFGVTGIIEGDWFNKFADGVQTATADIAKGVETAVSGMSEEIHVFTGRLSQARIDKEKAVGDLEAAREAADAEFNKALAEVEKLDRKYKKQKDKCSPKPWDWDNCVAAGALWTSLQTARGVLKVAQKVVDEFLKGTGKVLAKVIDGLNSSIQLFAKTIDVASTALGTAMSTFGNALEIAGQIAGEALSAIADVFDVEKLWMQGKLAVLNASQKGALGVEYTLMGKSYLKDVNWDFNVPVEKVFEVFKPGSASTGNQDPAPLPGNAPAPMKVAGNGADFAKFSYNPVTTAAARSVSESMIEAGQLKALTVPFNPEICAAHPYALEEQIKVVQDELTEVARRKRNADIYAWIRGLERSGDFMAVTANPTSAFQWAASGSGRGIPAGAISGGRESGRPNLYVCRGQVTGGVMASGKVVAGKCNVGWKGKEYTLTSYDVLTGDSRAAQWIMSPGGWKGAGVYVGKENGGDVKVCRASYKGGTHPGKIAPNGNCYIGWGGKEHRFTKHFEVLIPNRAYAINFKPLVAQYQAAKKSYAERDSAAKFNNQGKILQELTRELGKVPSSHNVRRSVEANFRKPEKVAEQLDPAWLGAQEKRLNDLYGDLTKLRTDPASPCGQVAKEEGVKPSPPQQNLVAKMRTAAKTITNQAFLQQSKTAQSVAEAARKRAAELKKAQQAQRQKVKQQQLVAFAKRVSAYQKEAEEKARMAAKVLTARAAIGAPPPGVTAQQRSSVAAAAKLAGEKAATAKVLVEPPKTPQPRFRIARPQQAKPDIASFKALPTTQRKAFAEAFKVSQQRALANKHAEEAADQNKLAQAMAQRNAKVLARLGKVNELSDQQKKVLAQSFAVAAVRARAELIKQMPVSRKSSLAARPSAEGEAAKAASTEVQDVARVQPSFRSNLRHLGIPVR